jgi:hypothetical protein
LDVAELSEVMIECKGSADTKSLNDCFARAIGKTPAFVIVLLKDAPRSSYVVFG